MAKMPFEHTRAQWCGAGWIQSQGQHFGSPWCDAGSPGPVLPCLGAAVGAPSSSSNQEQCRSSSVSQGPSPGWGSPSGSPSPADGAGLGRFMRTACDPFCLVPRIAFCKRSSFVFWKFESQTDFSELVRERKVFVCPKASVNLFTWSICLLLWGWPLPLPLWPFFPPGQTRLDLHSSAHVCGRICTGFSQDWIKPWRRPGVSSPES